MAGHDEDTSQFDQPTSLLSRVGSDEAETEKSRGPARWHGGADLGLLVLRVAVGATVGVHGAQKIFGAFGGPGIQGFAASLGMKGFTHTTVLAYVTGWTEMVGGLLLILGLLTPLAAAGVLGVLANAAYTKFGGGFFAANGGFEYEMVLAVAAFTLMFTGPGRAAMDAGRGWHRRASGSGVVGLVLAVAATVLLYVFARK